MTADADLPCPLCQAAAGGETVASLTGKDLRALWHELNRDFSEQSWGNISEDYEVRLFRCGQCGFQFFDPSLAGNGSFYEELQHENYYTPDRPEFALTLKFALKHGLRRILDVGCGTGRFLDLAKKAGMETFGLELNQNAAAEARRKNHTIWHSSIEEIATAETHSAFDLVTFFQVLEHVAAPAEVVRTASTLLRSGRFLAVSVPSAVGLSLIAPLDPHQWPPHHVSRWRSRDFAQLAKSTDMLLHQTGSDRLLGRSIGERLVLQGRLSRRLGRKSHDRIESLARPISFVYRKTGMKFLLPRWGSSLHAILRRKP